MVEILPISDQAIEIAAKAIRQGDLVAFPTETVYGLGADASNDRAVARIFEAKGRPRFNPLIAHVASKDDVRDAVIFDGLADRLADRFWPGPLTLVLPRQQPCPLSLLVSAGLETAAVRVPSDPLASKFLTMAGVPVAAPSANRSGRLSPTTAQHVADDLGDYVSIILDGGACRIGLESTVIDVSGAAPVLLRQGGLPQEDLESELAMKLISATTDEDTPRSPGMMASHYAPARPLRLNATDAGPKEALLGFGADCQGATLNLSDAGDLVEAAANLFAHLHELDRPEFDGIAVSPIPERGLGRAINDRLRRGAVQD